MNCPNTAATRKYKVTKTFGSINIAVQVQNEERRNDKSERDGERMMNANDAKTTSRKIQVCEKQHQGHDS